MPKKDKKPKDKKPKDKKPKSTAQTGPEQFTNPWFGQDPSGDNSAAAAAAAAAGGTASSVFNPLYGISPPTDDTYSELASATPDPAKTGYDHLQGSRGPQPYDHFAGFNPDTIGQAPVPYDALTRDKQTQPETRTFIDYRKSQTGVPGEYEQMTDEDLDEPRPRAAATCLSVPPASRSEDDDGTYAKADDSTPADQPNKSQATYVSEPALGSENEDGIYAEAVDRIPADQSDQSQATYVSEPALGSEDEDGIYAEADDRIPADQGGQSQATYVSEPALGSEDEDDMHAEADDRIPADQSDQSQATYVSEPALGSENENDMYVPPAKKTVRFAKGTKDPADAAPAPPSLQGLARVVSHQLNTGTPDAASRDAGEATSLIPTGSREASRSYGTATRDAPPNPPGLSRLQNLVSRLNIGLTHWWYQFCRYGLAAFPVGFLSFLIIEFAKLNPQEQEFIMQDPQNSLQFFTLQVLSIYYGSVLNNRLFLFTAPYPEVHGYEFALGDLNATYCVPQRDLVTAFSKSIKAQGFKETVKFIPGGVDQCFYPHENSTFPSGLWNLLGLSPADANDLNYHYTAMVFWVLIALSMAIVFANPTNVRTQTQILMGLIELAKSIAWVPFQLFGSLTQLFFMMTTFWCVNQQRRMLDWALGQLNGFLVVFSDHLGDNATALSLSERPSSVPRSLGCGLPVSYEAQLAVLRGLRVRLDDGITLNLGTRLAIEFDPLDDRINKLAQKGKLSESIAFADLLGLDTKELIAKHSARLLGLFFPEECILAEPHTYNPPLLTVIEEKIEQCQEKTLIEHNLEEGTANHRRVEALARASQHLARDVRNRFWSGRLRHEIIKHFENMRLAALQTNANPQQTNAIRKFTIYLMEYWPGLFAILMTSGYERALQALDTGQNQNRFAWFRGASDWKAYFRAARDYYSTNNHTAEQTSAIQNAFAELAHLYQCTDTNLLTRQFGNPLYEEPILVNSTDQVFENPLFVDPDSPDQHPYDRLAENQAEGYPYVAAAAPDATHEAEGYTDVAPYPIEAIEGTGQAQPDPMDVVPAAANTNQMPMTHLEPHRTGSHLPSEWTVRQVPEEERNNSDDDDEELPLLPDDTGSPTGTGVILRNTRQQGVLPILGSDRFGRFSQTEGYEKEDDVDNEGAAAAAPADTPSLHRKGVSHWQAEPESSNLLRHVSLQRRPSITSRNTSLAALFSRESVISFRELMTNEGSNNLFACDLRVLQVDKAAAEYNSANFENLHGAFLQVCDFRNKRPDTSRQLYVLIAALYEYCQQHPDRENQHANGALAAIRTHNRKLGEGKLKSADVLIPHLLGIYHLLFNPSITEDQRQLAIEALEKAIRLQQIQRFNQSGQRAAHARFHQPAAAASNLFDEAEDRLLRDTRRLTLQVTDM